MRRCRTLDRLLMTIALAVAAGFGLALSPREAAAQYANPVINGFEIAPAGSLEWEVIDRLAASHRYDPRDLPWLARMTVLESIAMYQSVRSDLPDSLIGARIEGEMSILWDSAQVFYLSASYGDATSLVRDSAAARRRPGRLRPARPEPGRDAGVLAARRVPPS